MTRGSWTDLGDDGDVTTTVDIAGGTKRYRRADGVIVATGTLDLQRSPQIVGVYTGTIDIVPGRATRDSGTTTGWDAATARALTSTLR